MSSTTALTTTTNNPSTPTAANMMINNTITLSTMKEMPSILRLPALPDGYTATVEAEAFRCQKWIKEVIIPEGYTKIDSDAFFGCINLHKVTLPSSLTHIGYNAFKECTSLPEITIPSSVTSIEGGAFKECTSLQQITIPSSVTTIGNFAFGGCSSLQQITIPSSVTSIEGGAFSGCTSLQQITIPSSVTSIKGCAFAGCTSLQQITIPSSVTSIRDSAFYGCTNLVIPMLGAHVEVGEDAFDGCMKAVPIFENPKVFVQLNVHDKACAICKDDFTTEPKAICQLSCQHVFHQECAFDWYKINPTCALCRTSTTAVSIVLPEASSVTGKRKSSVEISDSASKKKFKVFLQKESR